MTDADRERLERDFNHHVPTGNKADRHSMIRGALKDVASLIMVSVSDCRERSLAITKLEEAMFWSNAGISRSE